MGGVFPMHVINVSNLENNSGLFSLGLAVSMAIEANPNAQVANVPLFVRNIKVQDVVDTSFPSAEQRALSECLRLSLVIALQDDASFKEKLLYRFKQYCLDLNSPIPVGMDIFIKANVNTISAIKDVTKILSSYQYVINRFTEPSIPTDEIAEFRINLLDCMNQPYFDEVIVHHLLNNTYDIKNITDMFKICKIFSIVWPTINQNAINRASVLSALECWFLLLSNDIINLETTKEERLKKCILLGLCKTFIGDFPDIMNNAQKIFIQRFFENNIEYIYYCYVKYMTNNSEMISDEELKCLAAAWGVNLIIDGHYNHTDNVSNRLIVNLINETGDRWGIFADDSLLEIVSEEQNEKFKTLWILSETFEKIISNSDLSLMSSNRFKYIRNNCTTYKSVTGELLLKPIEFSVAADTIDGIVEDKDVKDLKSIQRYSNSTLWAFKQNQRAYYTYTRTNFAISLSAGALIESGAAIAGFCGAGEGLLLARAVQAGRAAGTAWEALNIGATLARTLTSPYLWGPLVIIEAYMFSRRKKNEFSDSFNKAFTLYKEAVNENDKKKFIQVDAILRAEIGEGINGRWAPARLSIWAQSSYDQCAILYYILADVNRRIGKDLVRDPFRKNSLQLFEKAYYYAKDEDIKWLGLFGIAQERWLSSQRYEKTHEKTMLHSEKVVKENIITLQNSNFKMVGNAFNDVLNALKYVLGVICFQKQTEALKNIEEILANNDIHIVKNLEPHGELCEVLFTFIQGVCLELKLSQCEEGAKSEVSNKAFMKFEECASLILDQKSKLNSRDKLKIAFMSEIRDYCCSFFKAMDDDLKNNKVVTALMSAALDGDSEAAERHREERNKKLRARRNAKALLSVD